MTEGLLILLGITACLVVETGCVALALWLLPDARRVLPASDGDES